MFGFAFILGYSLDGNEVLIISKNDTQGVITRSVGSKLCLSMNPNDVFVMNFDFGDLK